MVRADMVEDSLLSDFLYVPPSFCCVVRLPLNDAAGSGGAPFDYQTLDERPALVLSTPLRRSFRS